MSFRVWMKWINVVRETPVIFAIAVLETSFRLNKDAKRPAFMDSDFPDAGTDGGHRFPVIRIQAALDLVELKTR